MNKREAISRRLIALFVCLALALQGAAPAAAIAEQRAVEVDNHAEVEGAVAVSDLHIDDVEAPTAGAELDKDARVSSAEGATWDVPVLWVRDDLHVCAAGEDAEQERSYLPVIAFFVPQGYAPEGDNFTVTLSDSLSKLFGTQEIISVYDASTGVTYILPASLRELFSHARREANALAEGAANATGPTSLSATEDSPAQSAEPVEGFGDGQSIVDIFCAKTARDALTDEDLQWLLELILDYLQPQAVELLLDGFPSFRKAAEAGEIGKEIGLYVYYIKGDDDAPEHVSTSGALAYVNGGSFRINDELKYCYMIGIDVEDLLQTDDDYQPVTNRKTGKYVLLREGKAMETFQNTIVHELLHALMFDYNRTGMSGGKQLEAIEVNDKSAYIHKEANSSLATYLFPSWFVEGTASAVENNMQFRYRIFQILRAKALGDKLGLGDLEPTFTEQLLLDNYIHAWASEEEFAYFSLDWAEGGIDNNGKRVSTETSWYVSGYLATLYLSELSARYVYDGKSSVQTVDGVTTVDSSMLRNGLDHLLRWIHEGSTLDELIGALSPKNEDGQAVYTDTATFTSRFIQGTKQQDGTWVSEEDSLKFVTQFLNYMLYLERKLPEDVYPNGSILFDFDQNFVSPLDPNKKSSSNYLHIINSNLLTPSTVKSDTADIGGGKSAPTKATAEANKPEATLAAAAKTVKTTKVAKSAKSASAMAQQVAQAAQASDADERNEAQGDNEAQDGNVTQGGAASDATSEAPDQEKGATPVVDEVAADEALATETTEAADAAPAVADPVVAEQVVAEQVVAEQVFSAEEPVPAAPAFEEAPVSDSPQDALQYDAATTDSEEEALPVAAV